MSIKHLFLSLALATCAASLPLAAHADKTPLSDAAMAQVHGGLAVQSFTNPAASFQVVDRDNMQLSGSIIESLSGNTAVVSVFAGDSKIGTQMVTTGAPDANGASRGNFAFRSWALSNFPIGERSGKNLTLRFQVPARDRSLVSSCPQDPNVECIALAGNSENFPRNGITMDDNVIVNRVRILNLTDGTESSFLDPLLFNTMIDNEEFTQDRLFSPSVDAIFAQCPTNRRLQLRLDTNYDPGSFLRVPPGCTRLARCPDGMGFYANLAAQNLDVFHMFVVVGAGGDAIGRAPIGFGNFVLLRQGQDPIGRVPLMTAATIAHEIGHTRSLEHVEANCTQAEEARRDRNLMCAVGSNTFFLDDGRLVGDATFLSASQCNAIQRTANSLVRAVFPYARDIN